MPNLVAGRIPQRVDLLLYAGDSASYGVTVDEFDGSPVDVAVGQWTAQVKVAKAPDVLESFVVVVDPDTPGRLILTMDADASQRLGDVGQALRWDLQHNLDDSTVRTYAGGSLIAKPDVTRSGGVGAPHVTPPGTHGASRLTETGSHWLNEDGGYRLLEAS